MIAGELLSSRLQSGMLEYAVVIVTGFLNMTHFLLENPGAQQTNGQQKLNICAN